VTHEALIRASEQVELEELRELVRHIEAEQEPAQLQLLFQKLRTLVGLTEEESLSTEETNSTLLAEPPLSQPAE
jgi:hypothetical protein